jgi:hypothetical protein
MRIKTTMAVLLGCAWLSSAQTPDPVREALERCLASEESTQDLAGAAKAYTDALAAADARRAIHATALFRLAEVQRRQGKTNEATGLYRRLLSEFPDQAEMVAVARRTLADAGDATGGSSNSLTVQRLRMREQDLLQAERDLALAQDRFDHYQRLRDDQRLQWLAREVPTSRARMLLEKLATSQQELTILMTQVGPGHPDRQAAENLLKAIEEQVLQETSSAREALQSEMTFHKGRLAGLTDQVRELEKQTAAAPGAPGVLGAGLGAGPLNETERLLEDEIRVAEQQLVVEQRKFEAGRGSTEEVLKAQREVLNLKRQLAEKRQRRDLLDLVPPAEISRMAVVRDQLKNRLDAEYYRGYTAALDLAGINTPLPSGSNPSTNVPNVVVFGELSGTFPIPAGTKLMLSEIMLRMPRNDFARMNKVEIQRLGPDGIPMEMPTVNVEKLLAENDRSLDVELKQGDRIRVPRKVLIGL